MKIIAIYPGRFQPFSKHHAAAFMWLEQQFGKDNCYIVTSNKVDEKSPLDFNEKSAIINMYGITNIIESVEPYNIRYVQELLNLDVNNTSIVVLVGEKDKNRLSTNTKKDGTPSYYKKYDSKQELLPMSQYGYVLVVPHVSINVNDEELNGTLVRNKLGDSSISKSDKVKLFKEFFGWYSPKFFDYIVNKFSTTLNETKLIIKHPEVQKLRNYKGGNLSIKNLDISIDIGPYIPKNISGELLILHVKNFKSLPEGLTCKKLYVNSCPNFTTIPESLNCKDNLIVVDCPNFTTLPKNILTPKDKIHILNCLNFTEISKNLNESSDNSLLDSIELMNVTPEQYAKLVSHDNPHSYTYDEVVGDYKYKGIDDYIRISWSAILGYIIRTNSYRDYTSMKLQNEMYQYILKNNPELRNIPIDINILNKTSRLSIFDIIHGVLSGIPPKQINYYVTVPQDKRNKNDLTTNAGYVKNKNLLQEGGAAGHMKHIFELNSVNTGDELINAFEVTAKYLQKHSASVKIDGVNASIRITDIDGKKQAVLDRGSNKDLDIRGITKNDLLARFGQGHGFLKTGEIVLDIFNSSIPYISNELKMLGMWDNPNLMLNIEFVSGQTNVQSYDDNFLAIHNMLEVYQITPKRRGTKEVSYDTKALQELVKKVSKIAKKFKFKVVHQIKAKVESPISFNSILKKDLEFTINGETTKQNIKSWLTGLTIPKGSKVKFKDGKSVEALSKHVLVTLMNNTNLDELVEPEYIQDALAGFITYYTTMLLGDVVLQSMSSSLGPLTTQEGIVVTGSPLKETFKITGQFIIHGMNSKFRLNEDSFTKFKPLNGSDLTTVKELQKLKDFLEQSKNKHIKSLDFKPVGRIKNIRPSDFEDLVYALIITLKNNETLVVKSVDDWSTDPVMYSVTYKDEKYTLDQDSILIVINNIANSKSNIDNSSVTGIYKNRKFVYKDLYRFQSYVLEKNPSLILVNDYEFVGGMEFRDMDGSHMSIDPKIVTNSKRVVKLTKDMIQDDYPFLYDLYSFEELITDRNNKYVSIRVNYSDSIKYYVQVVAHKSVIKNDRRFYENLIKQKTHPDISIRFVDPNVSLYKHVHHSIDEQADNIINQSLNKTLGLTETKHIFKHPEIQKIRNYKGGDLEIKDLDISIDIGPYIPRNISGVLKIVNVENFKKLPKNLKCEHLIIKFCNNFTTIPENLNFEELKIFDCPNFTTIPENLSCKELDIRGCPNITKEQLRNLKNVEEIKLNNQIPRSTLDLEL